ncbi:MAG: PLP-dependent transferase, partial [Oscillospiraceae bacterium]|nr:PLP-dependent transferase [Oscillospiraceae bacterium]
EQLVAAGIDPGMIRFSVGLENVDDIIEDIKNAFDVVRNG